MIGDPFVSLEELALFLKSPNLAEAEATSALLLEHLEAAEEVVRAHVGPLASDETDVLVHASGRHLVLPMLHVGEVISITDPNGARVDVATTVVNAPAGVITVASGVRGQWSVRVAPTAGGSALRLAVKIIAAHLWGTQRGASARPAGVRAGSGEDMATTGFGYAVPRRAAELIAAHTLPAIA